MTELPALPMAPDWADTIGDTELIEFVRARLAEDEAGAVAAGEEHPCFEAREGRWQVVGARHVRYENQRGETMQAVDVKGSRILWYEQIWVKGDSEGSVAAHIARYDPARALREVEAKRRHLETYRMLVAAVQTGTVAESKSLGSAKAIAWGAVLMDAWAWADHPDYQQEWKP